MGFLGNNDEYRELEIKFADFTGSGFAVSCNTGTAALHLALKAVGVGPGDEVLVPDFTMAACAFAVSYCGATPIFVDVESDTYGMDPDLIEGKITKKTKAIMVVHVYGRLADMDRILRIAKKHKLPVIEDSSEAHGATNFSRADITCYSFYRNKIIHAEEGGICVTNRKSYADRMNFLKNMAFTEEHDYFHPEIGFNYRMSNAQAALVLLSLKDYQRNMNKRRDIEGWYDAFLPEHLNRRDAVWFYDAYLPKRNVKTLSKLGVRHSFKPLSTMPMYNQEPGVISTALSEGLILLPCDPQLTLGEIDYLVSQIVYE
jgi:dTDP-4-amino-4,6-dideoxygalactose transaminase